MNYKLVLFLAVVFLASCEQKLQINQEFYSSDIDNFWMAYDKVVSTEDSILQHQYLNDLFISQGTQGLVNIMKARNYTTQEYIDAINNYPKFWASIRENTYKAKDYDRKIRNSIQQLKNLYPDLKPAPIYFTIGALRTGGTILDQSVLIGSELSFADKSTITEELPAWRKPFFEDYNPIEGIELLCTHEYVHTQQTPLVDDLLTYCLYEGVAEFVSTKALGVPSDAPAIQFGKDNESRVIAKFEEDLFIPKFTYNWIWGENHNELKVRDLGYYIGYSICENNYEKAQDKTKAIKEMIELDFSNEEEVKAFVDASNFLSDSIQTIYEKFESSRPFVISVEPSMEGEISAMSNRITLNFSEEMDKESRGFDFGPLGEKHVLGVKKVIGFSEDGKSFSFEVELQPYKHYQSMVTSRFMSIEGKPIKPFLIDLKTGDE